MIPTFARWLHSAQMRATLPLQFVQLWWRGREHRGYRRRWRERLVWGGPRARPGALWLHAQTLNEMQSAEVLIEKLRQLDPNWSVLLSHGDAEGRGQAQVQALLRPGDAQVWLPFDTPGAARRFFARHRPRVGIFMERIARPNLLHRAARAGVPMVLANARLSAPDLLAAQQRPALTMPGFQSLALVMAQSHADAMRLAQAGAQQVRVFGNLDFDVAPPVKLIARGLEWRHAMARPVVLAAGTREGEEEPLLDAWKAAPAPRPLLVIVPRGAKRLAQLAFAVRERGLELRRRSAWSALPPEEAHDADVWLGDLRNEMAMYYGLADVALLGGSFAPGQGGQTLIEASACGCPVLIGPHAGEHDNVAELALAAGAAQRMTTIAEAVTRAIALAGDRHRDTWVRNAFAFTAAHRGTVNRVVGALLAQMTGRGA